MKSIIVIFSLLLLLKINPIFCQSITCNTTTERFSTGKIDDRGLLIGKLNDEIKAGTTSANAFIGWAVFNISSIPSNASINSIRLSVYTESASSSSSHCLLPVRMNNDPRSSDVGWGDLWYELNGSIALYTNDCSSAMQALGWHEFYLNSAIAIVDLQSKVESGIGWWGMGFRSNAEEPGIISGYLTTNHPKLIISYSLPCSSPSQPGAITGSTSVCQGSSQTYSIGAVTGATSYTWTLPSGWSGSSNTTSITATVGASGGTISVTANNSCGSSTPRTLSVSVTAIPAQPGAITGSTSVCRGSSQTYSISAVSGAISYTWTLPSGWSGSSSSTSITATAGASSGTISVAANNSCGSSSARTLNVSILTLDQSAHEITGPTSVCKGSIQTYSISPVSGATYYTWHLPPYWTGSSTSTSINVTVGSGSGSVSVQASNSCGSGAPSNLSVSVTATPAQPGSITGSTSVCQGSSQTYSISSVSGATSYSWTLPSGWSGSSTSTSITATTGASGGTISVTANNSCGSSTPRTLSVSVTATPAQPGLITGQTTVCQGSSQTYSIIPVSGATSYTWTLPSGWIGTSTSSTINATIGGNGGTISVTADNSCGSSLQSIMSITVTALPPQPGAIAGSTTITRGSSQTYSISAVAGATSYTWTLPSGWSGSSTSTSITATAGVEALSGNISVAANNSCGSGDPNAINVIVSDCNPPAQPASITGQTAVCQGSSQTYSITAVSGATSYTWTLPSGWSGSSTSTSITATTGASGGSISVTANNSCGSSAPRTLAVSVTVLPPQPGTISGEINVTPGQSYTYSIATVSGATSYTWSIPSGWSGSSTTTSITVTAGANGGDIYVTANNACGSSTPRTLTVTSTCNPPAQPGSMTGSSTVCQGSSQTYSISAVSGATSYTWTLPSGWSGSSNSNSITATVGATGGTISVTADNTCGSSVPSTLNIVLASKPAVTTANVSGTTTSTVTGGGNVTSNSGADITERGVCWSTAVNPTIYDSKTLDGTSNGSFTSIITDLTAGVTYHIRAFATNCSGTGYGSDITYFNNTTGIIDIQLDEISIYPNPVSDILNIEYKNDNYKTINIISSQGVLLEKEKVNSPRQQLDFSKYEYGFYILEFVKPSGEKMRVKIINH
jgi:hypothetical protein